MNCEDRKGVLTRKDKAPVPKEADSLCRYLLFLGNNAPCPSEVHFVMVSRSRGEFGGAYVAKWYDNQLQLEATQIFPLQKELVFQTPTYCRFQQSDRLSAR